LGTCQNISAMFNLKETLINGFENVVSSIAVYPFKPGDTGENKQSTKDCKNKNPQIPVCPFSLKHGFQSYVSASGYQKLELCCLNLQALKGTIIKSTGSWYQVLDTSGKVMPGRIRGKFRLIEKDTSNPIAVGDEVEFKEDPAYADTVQITQLYPRKNHIVRKSNKLSAKRQVIAANMDLGLMIASLVAPRTSLGFIDRFLVCCEAFHIPAILFFNKTDLLHTEGKELLGEIMHIYRKAGYTVLCGSAMEPNTLIELHNKIKGKTVMETGHSGVGKSTLLNKLYPGIGVKTQAINMQHETGKHTTTFAEMHIMPDGTRLIDTPGIRDFGVVDVPVKELSQYFPEFRPYLPQCKFNDCQHTNEPECAVKLAVSSGDISKERFYSYLSILSGEDVFE